MSDSTFQIGIDVGGTFTDIVASDGSGAFIGEKTPTLSSDQAAGVLNALSRVAARYELERPELLRRTEAILVGTTIATNTMLEYNGSKTGLLGTKGFRDMIELRRSYREDLFDLRYPPPVPICRRQRRLGVTERIDYKGRVVIPLDEDEARAAARRLRELEVESVAVCFLFAHVNPVHERRAREIVVEEMPDAFVTISSEVLPEIREFERLSTTLVNAYTTPRLKLYLERLSRLFADEGFAGDLLVTQSNGGVLVAGAASERGVDSVRSGPASGVVAAAHLGSLCEAPNVIGVDMGGTSYDVSLIRNSTPQLRTDAWVGRYRVALPVLDIHAIGAGGGSIGWLDGADALHVGPRSAGADPGPACYANGGTEPTVTDANLILGYLSSSLLGGELKLDRGLAEQALGKLAEPLGVTVEEAATGILRVINNTMNNGVRYISVARGHDPRDFTLMAFGGAGAIHAAMQARDLGVSRVLVPKDASVFCALGALTSDVKVSLIHPYFSRGSEAAVEEMERIFGGLRGRAEATISHAGEKLAEVHHHPFIDARYMGQTHEVTVPIDVANGSLGESELREGIARFHDMHEQLYSFKSPDQDVELINLRYDLIGVRDKPGAGSVQLERDVDPLGALRERRDAYFEIDGRFERVKTPVFDGGRLRPGNSLKGPCIIEEPHTTIVVCPGQSAWLSERLVYDIDVALPGGDT